MPRKAKWEEPDKGLYPPEQLDEKGRCCGKKPRVYLRWPGPYGWCDRCCRGYDLDTGIQVDNYHYRFDGLNFKKVH